MAGMGINDYGGMPHTSDMAMKSKTHTKEYQTAEGMGGIKDYPDTTEQVHRDQRSGESQIKKQPMKPGYRY
jgi:hypothetical protein